MKEEKHPRQGTPSSRARDASCSPYRSCPLIGLFSLCSKILNESCGCSKHSHPHAPSRSENPFRGCFSSFLWLIFTLFHIHPHLCGHAVLELWIFGRIVAYFYVENLLLAFVGNLKDDIARLRFGAYLVDDTGEFL